jgi:heme/copper-type cytochrome/quinol oxidase subunit 3
LALLVSGFAATRALASVRGNNREAVLRNILIAMGLGVVFLVGIAFVWRQVQPAGSYTAIFFTMTGFHAFHVLAGMLLLGYAYRKAQQGAYTAENHWSLEGTVTFWHFVDLMWILYFVMLYII